MAYKKGSKEAKAHMAKVRASKISGVKKKAVAKKTTTRKKSVAKKPVNISYDNSWGKYLDSNKPAKKAGKRTSKPQYYKDGSVRNEGGKVYYEYRRNRTDVNQRAKKGQMLGIGNSDLKKYSLKQYNNSLDNIKGFEILISKIENIIANNRITKTYNSSTILELKKELKKSKELLKEHKLHSKELKKFL
jgi:hypothetical protein